MFKKKNYINLIMGTKRTMKFISTFIILLVVSALVISIFSFGVGAQPIANINVNPTMLSDSEVGLGTFSIVVSYNEDMDLLVDPTIDFPFEDPTNTISFNTGSWTSIRNYTAYYDVADASEEVSNIRVRARNAQNASGTTQFDFTSLPLFNIDNLNPTATVTRDTNPIYDSDLVQVITLTYNETMDGASTPVISFSGNTSAITSAGAGSWSVGNTVWTQTFNHIDANEASAVTVSSSGVADVNGNVEGASINANYNVDTRNPTGIITVNTDPVYEGDLVQTVTINYNEAMNPSSTPTINFAGNVGAITPAGTGVWSVGNTRWTQNFNVADVNEETAAVTVSNPSGATDAVGNSQQASTTDNFAIDTLQPTLTFVHIQSNNPNSNAIAGVGDAVTISLTSSETLSGLPAVTIDGNPAGVVPTGGNNYNATYIMVSGDTQGALAFTINFVDSAGNNGVQVTSVTDGSSVSFDETAPLVNLITPSDLTITKADAGSALNIDIDFNENMDPSVSPIVSFNPNILATGTLVFNAGLSLWVDANTYRSAYNVFDVSETQPDVDIIVNTARDYARNVMNVNTSLDKFDVDTVTPTLTTRSIASNNANITWAKIGDLVIITFTASENLTTPTVTIRGSAATVTQGATPQNWNATRTMLAADTEGIIPFTIDFSDSLGNAGVQVTTTTDGSNVTFDRTIPYLTSTSITGGYSASNVFSPQNVDGQYDNVTINMTSNEVVYWKTLFVKDSSGTNVRWYFCTDWLTNCSKNWNGTDSSGLYVPDGTYSFVLDFDTGESLVDYAGNANSSITIGTAVVDNTAPIATITVGTASIRESDLTQEITLTYSEQMNALPTPVIGFAGNTGVITSNGDGTWATTNVWTETFNITDADEENNVTVSSSGARDLVGNIEGSSVNAIFAIDTLAPLMSNFQNYTADGIINNDDDVIINATIIDVWSGVAVPVLIEGNWTGSWQNYSVANDGNNNYPYTVTQNFLENQELVGWRYYALDSLGNLRVSPDFSFLVENRAPIFNVTTGPIQNLTWIEDQGSEIINITPYFYDLDLDDLNYTAVIVSNPGPTSNPLGGSITVIIDDNTGIATISSTTDWNGNGTIVFYAWDFVGASAASNTVYVIVETDENEVPTLTTSISPINFSEDTSLSFDILCDPEDVGQVCQNYRYDPNYVSYNPGLQVNVNPVTGAVTLSTQQDWYGVTYVRFLADDNGIPSQTGQLISRVNVTPVNDNPILNVPIQNINEDNGALNINLASYTTDVDNAIPADMTWTLIRQSNASLVNCSVAGSTLSCTVPAANMVGYNQLDLQVNDNAGGIGTQALRINVNSVNDAPVINSSLPLSYTTTEDTPIALAIYLKPYETDVDVYDVDANLTWSVTGVDTSLFTTTINNASDTLIISPVLNKYGSDSFTLYLTDSFGAQDSATITVTITPVNDLPVLSPIGAQTATVGILFSYDANASDVDTTDTLTFSDDTSMFNIIPATGVISFTPVLTDYGPHTINISVSDGNGGIDYELVNFFVDFDRDPTITSANPTYDPIIRTGDSQQFSITATDIDDPVLNYEWFVNGIPQGVNSNSYLYSSAAAGNYVIRVEVSDSGANMVYSEWNLIVSDIPVATAFTGDETTNLSQVPDLSNVQNFTLENAYGKIQYLVPVDLSNAWDLNNNVIIQNGLITVNTALYPSLNMPARISFYGLSYSSIPEVLYTSSFTTNPNNINQDCSQCNITSYTDFSTSNGEVVFEVQNTGSFRMQGSGEIYDLSELDINACENGVQGNLVLDVKKPDQDESFGPMDEIGVKVKVENENADNKRIIVESVLFDIDDNEELVSEKSDSQKIDAGNDETFETNIEVPEDFNEEDSHFIFIKAYEKGSEDSQCNYQIVDVELEREEHETIIEDVAISPVIGNPGGELDIGVKVKNIGSEEEENAYIQVTSTELGISKKSIYFNLEEFGEDDSALQEVTVAIPADAKEGDYDLKIDVVFDGGKNSLTKTITIMNATEVPALVSSGTITAVRSNPIYLSLEKPKTTTAAATKTTSKTTKTPASSASQIQTVLSGDIYKRIIIALLIGISILSFLIIIFRRGIWFVKN